MTAATDFRKEPHRRFVAEALLIRAESAYLTAWQHAKDYNVDVSADREPDLYDRLREHDRLRERYVCLLDEWAVESPPTAGSVCDYLDLVAAIVEGELSSFFEGRSGAP